MGSVRPSHDNNFQLIKFLAATTVVLCHSIPVAWGPHSFPDFIGALGVPVYDIAVDVFFVVSGYLVVGSLIGRGNLLHFAEARLRRLLPALALSVFGSLLVVGFFFTNLPLGEFWGHPKTWKFAIANSLPLVVSPEQTLPGAFWGNPLRGFVNPSLWTLPWEIRMYLGLGSLFALFSRFPRIPFRWGIAVVYVVTALIGWWLHAFPAKIPPLVLLTFRFAPSFFGGALLKTWKDRIWLDWRVAAALFIAMFSAFWDLNAFFAVYEVALPYLVVFTGCVPSGPIRLFNRVGDYSYGLYIFSFPIQQVLRGCLGPISLATTMAASLVGALIFAVPSWHFVEKPLMKRRNAFGEGGP